jgi:hypothetical protein
MNRLEMEHGKLRLIEGNFAAARYHMAITEPRTLRVRAALVCLHVAPRLIRRLYLALRPPMPHAPPAMIR